MANKFIISHLERQGVTGIVPSHGDILVALFQGEKYTMKELADKIHRTKPTVTVLIDKLVKYGFVEKEKCAIDSRVTYVKLTPKGAALEPIVNNISEKLNDLIYGDFTETEADVFEQLLNKVKFRLDKKI